MIDFALRHASNIHHQHLVFSKTERAGLEQHRPAVLWFTGSSGAGKSTIANLVQAGLHARGVQPCCSTATTCATASTRTSALPRPAASKTFTASARLPS